MKTLNKISSESVEKATGKNWGEWINIIDKFGGEKMLHKNIAKKLIDNKLINSQWWAQTVTVGYEQVKGKRIVGQREKGNFEVSVQKNTGMKGNEAWKKLISEKGIKKWLELKRFNLEPGFIFKNSKWSGEVRTVSEGTNIRIRWYRRKTSKNPEVLIIDLVPGGKSGSVAVRIQHEGLPDNKTREQMKNYWKKKLNDLITIGNI